MKCKITKINNHIVEEVIAEEIELSVNSIPKYENEFGEEFILMPIYYSTTDKVYEYKVIFLSDLNKLTVKMIKINGVFIDYIMTYNDFNKIRSYYIVNNKNEDYVTLYEL